MLRAEPGRLRGPTSAVEDGTAHAARYDVRFDEHLLVLDHPGIATRSA